MGNLRLMEDMRQECRFFVSYSGVKLPFNLVNAIAAEALSNRNTFIRAYFDAAGLLMRFEKVVYGEVELAHRYEYHQNGILSRAEIVMLDEEHQRLLRLLRDDQLRCVAVWRIEGYSIDEIAAKLQIAPRSVARTSPQVSRGSRRSPRCSVRA